MVGKRWWALLLVSVLVAACGTADAPRPAETGPTAVADSGGDGQQVVRDAARRFLEAGNVKAIIDIGVPEEPTPTRFHETVRFGQERLLEISEAGVDIAFMDSEGDLFLRSNLLDEQLPSGQWLALDTDEADDLLNELHHDPNLDGQFDWLFTQLVDGGLTELLVHAVTRVEEVSTIGREVVGGVASTHYLGRTAVAELSDSDITVEVWIADDGFLAQLSTILSSALTGAAAEMTLTFQELGVFRDPIRPTGAMTLADFEQFAEGGDPTQGNYESTTNEDLGLVDGFVLPSGNIFCAVTTYAEGGLECSIASLLDPSPGPCEVDWTGIFLPHGGSAEPVCAGDALLGGADPHDLPRLDYGQSWGYGDIACSAEQTGLSCENEAGGGFTLARASWSTW